MRRSILTALFIVLLARGAFAQAQKDSTFSILNNAYDPVAIALKGEAPVGSSPIFPNPNNSFQILSNVYDPATNSLQISVTWPLTSTTANPARSGAIRLANNTDKICWENAAGTGVVCIYIDSSNILQLPSPIGLPGGGQITGASGDINLTAAGTNQNITFTPSGNGASVATNFQDKGGQVYNVRAYGAVGNGVFLYNCSTTSGSPALNCPSANWSASDAGKPIEVDLGTSGSAPLYTSILSVTDATHLTMSANAGSTASTRSVVYGTDDSTVIQSLVNTVIAAGGGTIFFPPGVYIYNRAANQGQNLNSALLIPRVLFGVGLVDPSAVITFKGATQVGEYNYDGAVPPGASVLYAMSNVPPGGKFLYVNYGDGNWSNFNNVVVGIRDLAVVTPYNVAWTAVDLTEAISATVNDSTISINTPHLGTTITVPSLSSYGLFLPGNQNFGIPTATNVSVFGYNVCYQFSDHTLLTKTQAQFCHLSYVTGGFAPPVFFNGAYALDSDVLLHLIGSVNAYGTLNLEATGVAFENPTAATVSGVLTFGTEGTTPTFSNTSLLTYYVQGGAWKSPYVQGTPVAFSTAAACSSTLEGRMQAFSDSTTATWGATIAGGGTNHVLGYCDGTSWTVGGM